MTDDVFTRTMADAEKRIRALPADQQAALLPLLEETRRRHQELKTNFARVQESVDEWRLCMKYLVFDLEATRRELRSRLHEQGEDPAA